MRDAATSAPPRGRRAAAQRTDEAARVGCLFEFKMSPPESSRMRPKRGMVPGTIHNGMETPARACSGGSLARSRGRDAVEWPKHLRRPNKPACNLVQRACGDVCPRMRRLRGPEHLNIFLLAAVSPHAAGGRSDACRGEPPPAHARISAVRATAKIGRWRLDEADWSAPSPRRTSSRRTPTKASPQRSRPRSVSSMTTTRCT